MIRVIFFALTFVVTGSTAAFGDERTDESAKFDLKSLAELVKQVRALEGYRDNEFVLEDKTVALDKSVQRFQGVEITWELTVQQVQRQAVYLRGVATSTSQIYFVKELPEEANDSQLSKLAAALRQQQLERQLFRIHSEFKIGSTVDAAVARGLRRGDKVTVRGEIARIGVDAGRLLVVVSNAKLLETAESIPNADPPVATVPPVAAVPPVATEPWNEHGGGGEPIFKSSVGSALQWFAKHQLANGGWSFDHRSGECAGRCANHGTLTTATGAATAMALLPFLGAGETHQKGEHKEVIHRGLSYLIKRAEKGEATASFLEPGGTMYSHGLCSIALCEAYRSSGDEALRETAQLSLNFIAEAQDPVGGGWRYMPRQSGDTSVSGWQISAIHAGQMANLEVPEKTVIGATRFLDAVQSDGGAKYGYTTPGAGLSTTSIGLLSRLRFGWERDNDAIKRGVQFLQSRGPSNHDMYYNYHSSQVMFQYGGDPAEKWHQQMRAFLVEKQDQEGHQAGSWYFPGGHAGDRGGRLYCTSLAVLTLEIYYRHLAIFRPSQEHVPEEATE